MFSLEYLELHDFFSFESCAIKFTKGLILITGYDESGKDSNGSGKSTILNGICFALWGRTLKGIQGKDVIRFGQKDCKVILIIKGEGHIYEIERTSNSLIFKIDNTIISGNKSDIQLNIENSFASNYPLFIRSTAFSQSQVEFIGAASDVEKKKLFKEILSLSRLDKAYDAVRSNYDTTFSRLDRLDAEITTTTQLIEQLKQKIESTRSLNESWEAEQTKKKEALLLKKNNKPRDKQIVETNIKAIEHKLKNYDKLDPELQEVEQELNTLDVEKQLTTSEIKRLYDTISKANDLGQRCEICGSVVNKKMLQAHHKELEDKIVELTEKNDMSDKMKNEIVVKKLRIQRELLDRRALSDSLLGRQRDLARLELDWEYYNQMCEDIDKQLGAKNDNPYNHINMEYDNELRTYNKSLDDAQKEFDTKTKSLDTYAFLKFVLSREGAVTQIIEREFATLTNIANKFLSNLSGGTIQLYISPQRELKSKTLREEIDIMIYMDGKKAPYWGISDGQRARINIALLLALNKLCMQKQVNSFDFLLLDEVVDLSLDEGGEEAVTYLLKNYNRECSLILVVSHKEKFKSSFTSTISVYRDKNGISHLRK